MPYVLKHKESAELYACKLLNSYELVYFGVKAWDDEGTAAGDRIPFLAARGTGDAESWTVAEIDEMKLKMANVKLKNDPSNRVLLDEDGTLRVEKRLPPF
ncbi:hypothetical protein [Paenibacillus flagellatus]|uniref:Uncharacterized protein n=1 Tax=Paenibacillus flagellatus TaxID=2211139 RepID=A0A2V5K9U7_9BACL|nr:hypothetical protein [Paenibacillus flagellatus]PYI56291.1 hypothetical protein DLM86_04715 [Paenibacillus flagellatus]